jgi:flavin reductase (DIM6/NTAB) family NADH-FMN oxidoreductase RutF
MRRVPAAVAVVTVEAEGRPVGLTVASLVSLSLDPPLVGFAIRRDAALHELLRESQELAISILAADQEHLAQHFARGVPPIALWERIPLRDDEAPGPPQLADSAAWLRGRVEQEHATGDHTFFVATVESAEPGPRQSPLVLHDQAYAAL